MTACPFVISLMLSRSFRLNRDVICTVKGSGFDIVHRW